MLLWLAISGLAVFTVIMIAVPFLRRRNFVREPDGSDNVRDVYRDQLGEVDADLKRGLIDPTEAAGLRIELSRRLLSQADPSAVSSAAASASRSKPLPFAMQAGVILAVPVIALLLYAPLGSPKLPGQPAQQSAEVRARAASSVATDVDALVAKVEERLRGNPDDGRGWDVIAPVYARLMRYDEARAAYAHAIALLGETTKRLAGFADSAIRGSDGRVADDARAAYEKVAASDPSNVEARFWLSMAHEQRGETAKAIDGYRALLASAQPDAPWRTGVADRLAALTAAPSEIAPSAKGPTESDVSAAGAMTSAERQRMILGMIDNLHARLKAEGKDASGWQRLLRAYGVLGDLPKAQAALAEARSALAADKEGRAAIEAVAKEMGLGS